MHAISDGRKTKTKISREESWPTLGECIRPDPFIQSAVALGTVLEKKKFQSNGFQQSGSSSETSVDGKLIALYSDNTERSAIADSLRSRAVLNASALAKNFETSNSLT